jgi:hypothetical protein
VTDRVGVNAAWLNVWERGEPERAGRRALTLLASAAPDSTGDLAAVPVGRRDRWLLDLREGLFGRGFSGLTACPACGEEVELTFDVSEVRRDPPSADRGQVQAGGVDLHFRLPTSGDIVAIESAADVRTARAALLGRCFEAARRDGAPIPFEAIPATAVEAAIARMRELDPQADVALDVACPACAHAWSESFDIVTFLWSELSAWARRTLGEVHLLASAYGWTEADILQLSAARRHVYLEMLR